MTSGCHRTPPYGAHDTALLGPKTATTGNPTATAVISDDGSNSLVTPWGCTFDDVGRLWVYNYGTSSSVATTISKFGPAQLAANGASSPTPHIVLSGLPPFAAQITFGPRY